ncbi:Uncharacterised protein [Mycobacterium tuberculosis]|uniref:Uncharacterized protein n=1 Tax=Kroppenstedtia eburnea TaxID=714067 RepID=A0A1N7LBS2_9BACL|nr:Uncharacterised protein [Mycobacterium tuberculosis]SIS71231.1 hypothetical protein SAMN05421790_10474 [Kroppenstedtia eburnea]
MTMSQVYGYLIYVIKKRTNPIGCPELLEEI